MALYKKEKVNPMWSCWFLLIQMPILFVLYRVILDIREPGNAYYVYDMISAFNVESIISNFYGLFLFETGMNKPVQWVILALLVWLVQFIQIKLSLAQKEKETKKGAVLEKKKDKSWYESMMPDPDTMNKFMLYWMPLMVTVFTFSFFAGLGLYWGISTICMIIQQLVVNKVLKKEIKK
jgi:YidC/Oxa1 family membrane protein insertase